MEFKTVVRDISNEGVAESLGLIGFKFFESVAANLEVHIEAEVLEALVDTQVNGWAKSGIQIPDHFISKGLGLIVVLNMDTRDDNVP